MQQYQRAYKTLVTPTAIAGVAEPRAIYVKLSLPIDALDKAIQHLGIAKQQMADLLGVSLRTIQKKRQGNSTEHLDENLSERTLAITELFEDANEYFDDHDKAVRWMNRPNRSLGDVSPLSLCTNFAGMARVQNQLNKLKYGFTA